MKKALLLQFVFVLIANFVKGQSDLDKIKALVIAAPEINVANESTDPNGDILTPRQSIGFSGSGSNRIESFEEKRRLTKRLEKYVAFNPNADALYPGSLIQGKSLVDGVLNPIVLTDRNPLTVTITDLVTAGPQVSYSKTVQKPSLSSVTDAVGQILNTNLQGSQPSKISYAATAMSSIEEGFLKLGASYKWASGSVSGSFQTNKSVYKTSYMIRFVQSYYTVSCEPPTNPTSFFTKKVKFADFANYASESNPPTYVASVTYGRELWMLIESNYESSALEATLNATFSSGFAGGSVSLNDQQRKILNESSVQILILGGSGTPAVEVIAGDHVAKLRDYLLSGANYSKTSPGVIISYTVRYLKNNNVARVSSATDYTIKTDVASPEIIKLTNVRVFWSTTGDDKDWNTQPFVELFDKNGRRVASLGCCSSDRNGDKWDKGRTESRNLNMEIGGLTLDDLAQGRFSANRNPVGNDDWDYTATIELTFTNGIKNYSCSGRNSCSVSW